ncbi:hypothetical protein BGZ65_001569, partial [Modicella reniformis]
MSTLAETYIAHVGNVFDLLVQDKDLDPASQAFNSLPLDFVDASTPQYIQKADVSLQQVVQMMFKLKQEVAHCRKALNDTTHPVGLPSPSKDTDLSSNCSPTAISTPTDYIPCNDCVQKCAFVAKSAERGDLRILVECHNKACNQSTLVVSINEMVTKLSRFSGEVIRVVAQGVEGKLG